jgi:hypothetical protein
MEVVVCMYVAAGATSAAEKEGPVPHPGFHSARGLLQALVSSRNRSSDWTRFGFSSSCGNVRIRCGVGSGSRAALRLRAAAAMRAPQQ